MVSLKTRISAPGLAAAIGAGFAAALLSMLVEQKTPVAAMMGFIAPLPIMIAALGFGSLAGLVSLVVGAIAIGVFDMRPEGLALVMPANFSSAGLDVLGFAVGLGVPAWLLARLAALPAARLGATAEPIVRARPDEIRIGRILAVAIGFAAAGAALDFAVAMTREGGFAAFMASTITRAEPLVKELLVAGRPLPKGISIHEIAVGVTWLQMPMTAGYFVVRLAFNLWLAARIAQTSKLLTEAWPDIPRFTRLPRALALVLAAALGLAFAGGIVGMMSLIVGGALLVGFALQGLAVVHAVTREKSFRTPLLIIVYLSLALLMPWLLALYGLLGLADTAFAFRDRERRPPAPPGPWGPAGRKP